MFEPGFDDKGLEYASFLGSILEYSPIVCAHITSLGGVQHNVRRRGYSVHARMVLLAASPMMFYS